jgi:hypothetical protein
MKNLAWLAASAVVLSTVVMAGHQVAMLDGTSWKIEVEPDSMAKDKGEKQFKETMTFADGSVSLSTPKAGFNSTPYSVTKTGEKELTFKASRTSSGEGDSVLTGTVRGKEVDGKLIWTKTDGSVLTYTFKGEKLD